MNVNLFWGREGEYYFVNLSHFIYVTLHLGRGIVKENLRSVTKYAGFFYTFTNMDILIPNTILKFSKTQTKT